MPLLEQCSDQPRRPRLVLRLLSRSAETIVSAPVHSLGFIWEVFRQIRRASQLHPNILNSTQRTGIRSLSLAFICKSVAVPTSENGASVENCNTSRAASRGAEKPWPLPSVIARCEIQEDRVFLAS